MIKTLYLCIVFFMVLDLRLTKIGTQRSPFFYFYPIPKHRFPPSPTTIRIAKVSPEHGIEAPAHWEGFGGGLQ